MIVIFLFTFLLRTEASCLLEVRDCSCPISPLDVTCSEAGLINVPRITTRLRYLRLPLNYIQFITDSDMDIPVSVLDLRGQYVGCVMDYRQHEHPIEVYGLCDKVC